jgi:hypothetical protein
MKNPIDKVETFVWNIKNIAEWVPVLWNNWDWDYGRLLDIMVFKLERMSKFFGTDAIVGDKLKTKAEIQQCIFLINKFRNYENEAFEPYHTKFRNSEYYDQDLEIIMNHQITEEEGEMLDLCTAKSIELRNKYKRELIEFLVEHFDNWSD